MSVPADTNEHKQRTLATGSPYAPRDRCTEGEESLLRTFSHGVTTVLSAMSCALVLSLASSALAAPRLELTKTPDNAVVYPGQEIRFKFTVKNIGDEIADSPQLADVLPGAGVIHWSSDFSKLQNYACYFLTAGNGQQTWLCDFPALFPGEQAESYVYGTAVQCPNFYGSLANVFSDNTDPRSLVDAGSFYVNCAATTLSIDTTPDAPSGIGATINAGELARFTIVVANNGTGVAKNAAVDDRLPSGLTWSVESLSGTPSLPMGNTCAISGGNHLSCDFGALAAGETRRIVVTATTMPISCAPQFKAGSGLVALDSPAAFGASNAMTVENSGMILCRTANPCDISLDVTCSIDAQSLAKPAKFECPDPFDGFSVEWDPGATNDAYHPHIGNPDQVVDIRIWNGPIGSAAPVDIGGGTVIGPVVYCNVQPGDVVTVGGLAGGKKKPADEQSWEIFEHDPSCVNGIAFSPTKTRLGISKFRINCKDAAMKEAADCGTLQGDGRAAKTTVTGLVNDWRLAGITGNKKGEKDVLACNGYTPSGAEQQNCAIANAGDLVTYQYSVTNNGAQPVSVDIGDNRKPGGVVATGIMVSPKNAASPMGNRRKFTWGPVPIGSTTVSLAKATGNPGAADQCEAIDRVIVTTPCLMGNPATGQLYPYGDATHPRTSVVFNESETLSRLEPSIATSGQTLRLWYSDEHAMLLGIRSATFRSKNGVTTTSASVSPFIPQFPVDGAKLASDVLKPLTGLSADKGGVDPAGRPIAPSLFCTDVTDEATSIAGDWQMGGAGQGPHFVSGTWKSATVAIDATGAIAPVVTTDADPPKNGLVVGRAADPVPAGLSTQGYVSEVRWNVDEITCKGQPLRPGRTYRMQFMVHDGDQNKTGGDVGQACATVSIAP